MMLSQGNLISQNEGLFEIFKAIARVELRSKLPASKSSVMSKLPEPSQGFVYLTEKSLRSSIPLPSPSTGWFISVATS
jgi:hypothetical protein